MRPPFIAIPFAAICAVSASPTPPYHHDSRYRRWENKLRAVAATILIDPTTHEIDRLGEEKRLVGKFGDCIVYFPPLSEV